MCAGYHMKRDKGGRAEVPENGAKWMKKWSDFSKKGKLNSRIFELIQGWFFNGVEPPDSKPKTSAEATRYLVAHKHSRTSDMKRAFLWITAMAWATCIWSRGTPDSGMEQVKPIQGTF